MKADSMIHQANQIALFFASYPHDEALTGVVSHFTSFWPPRMKTQIKDYVAHGGTGLHELALEAVKQLAAK